MSYFHGKCGCGHRDSYKRSGCCGHSQQPVEHHVQNNVSYRNYYGRPIHCFHPEPKQCHSMPTHIHGHNHNCNCHSKETTGCGCCKPNAKQVAVIESGSNGAVALFNNLDCGTYMITRSEHEENSVLTVDGSVIESTVGTEFVVGSNNQGSAIITFDQATNNAGFLEIIQIQSCEG